LTKKHAEKSDNFREKIQSTLHAKCAKVTSVDARG